MPIFLNAFPIKIPDVVIEACVIPYEKERLIDLRNKYQDTHAVRRQGDKALIFSADGSYPVAGEKEKFSLIENYGLFCFLCKDAIKKHLSGMGRFPLGFHPIEIISARPDDDLLSGIVEENFPFQISPKYRINTRIIDQTPCLTIDCSTRQTVSETCKYFLDSGFDLIGRYVVKLQDDGYRKLLGKVVSVDGDLITVELIHGEQKKVTAGDVYLEADSSRENFDAYLLYSYSTKQELVSEKIRVAISIFNGGENKKSKIRSLKNYFQSRDVRLVDGSRLEIFDSMDVTNKCRHFDKPVFIFNDNGQAKWAEKGFKGFGPYTKGTFDRNDPSICVICGQHDKGGVEQFVRKFLKGIPNHNNYSNGFEGKFSLGISNVEVFTTPTNDVSGYKAAIERAIRQKSENGGKWDLALVQVRQSFKKLEVAENPYYVGKSLFFLHQVPVQDFTIELLSQKEYNLGYSLNNMALASYAKMGGVPWLLRSSPTLSHELVIGIGSANIGNGRGVDKQRVMGITTVFSGDGSYIVSNTSKAVSPKEYCSALASVLNETIDKIKRRMNWQQGDTIRLIFHASVKKFNKDEIQAVRTVIEKYKDYQIEYAFLKISEDHGLHLFDSSTSNEKKGRLAPLRGKNLKLSKYEMLVYLIGQRELKQGSDGHPRGVILSVHRDSTFKDIKYLSAQLFSFSSHSWRSYFPNPMPVTISYSDLIARNLGWLNKLPGWNDSTMVGKIGQSQWFL